MGNIQCCDVRIEQLPEHGLITKQEVKLQPLYELTPRANAKYNALLKRHNNDPFLLLPPTRTTDSQLQAKQGFSFLPSVNAYYHGEWNEQKKPEGTGRLIFKNGSLLVGRFKDFKCDFDSCHLIFKDGGHYHGAIRNSKLAGRGKLTTQALQYEGYWEDNLPEGDGDELMSNGDRFIGTFRKGKKHGQNCLYKWYNHKIFVEYEGQFEDGLLRGRGSLHLRNGCKVEGLFRGEDIEDLVLRSPFCKYTGNCVKGKLEGRGSVEVMARRETFQGVFREGELFGQCVQVDSKNRRTECFVFNGKRLAKVVGLCEQEISDLVKCIEEVYSRIESHEQAIRELNLKFNGEYLCEMIEPFALESSHKKYMVIHFNRCTIRILAGP